MAAQRNAQGDEEDANDPRSRLALQSAAEAA